MYKYYVYPDELYHHGVKGMKWGVRHDPEYESTGRKRSAKSKGLTTKQKAIIAHVTGVALAGVAVGIAIKHANTSVGENVVKKLDHTPVMALPAPTGYNTPKLSKVSAIKVPKNIETKYYPKDVRVMRQTFNKPHPVIRSTKGYNVGTSRYAGPLMGLNSNRSTNINVHRSPYANNISGLNFSPKKLKYR